MTPGAFWQNVWRPLLCRSGPPCRKLHTLRHTYASLLIQNRESLAYIRDQLGHHSIKQTVDAYGHLVPGTNQAAVDRLDDATGRNPYATSSSGGETRMSEDKIQVAGKVAKVYYRQG